MEPGDAEAQDARDQEAEERDIEGQVKEVERDVLQPDGECREADAIEGQQRGGFCVQDTETLVQMVEMPGEVLDHFLCLQRLQVLRPLVVGGMEPATKRAGPAMRPRLHASSRPESEGSSPASCLFRPAESATPMKWSSDAMPGIWLSGPHLVKRAPGDVFAQKATKGTKTPPLPRFVSGEKRVGGSVCSFVLFVTFCEKFCSPVDRTFPLALRRTPGEVAADFGAAVVNRAEVFDLQVRVHAHVQGGAVAGGHHHVGLVAPAGEVREALRGVSQA